MREESCFLGSADGPASDVATRWHLNTDRNSGVRNKADGSSGGREGVEGLMGIEFNLKAGK